jgi:DUF1365 family protein
VVDPQAATEHGDRALRFRFRKQFHVSPFLEMALDYDWRFVAPGEAGRLAVHMEDTKEGAKVFDATLTLARREITAASLAHALVAFPLMSLQVVAAIHWQALRLWLKRCPTYAHPRKRAHPHREER